MHVKQNSRYENYGINVVHSRPKFLVEQLPNLGRQVHYRCGIMVFSGVEEVRCNTIFGGKVQHCTKNFGTIALLHSSE